MRLKKPENPNYAAVIVKVKAIIPLEKCDNVVAINVFGFQAIVSKETKLGDLGVFFPAETQLSEDYCHYNNLYRHPEKNDDPTKKGYFEDNRRVKAVKFRGHRSSAIFMPLSSLGFITDIEAAGFDEGDEFDEVNDIKVCQKYVVPRSAGSFRNLEKQKKVSRVDAIHLPEHFSTDNYFRNSDTIHPDQGITVTQKLHGTSIRIANTIVKRKKTFRDRIAAWFGVKVQETEFDYVFGSRKVIKDANNPDHKHFYDSDIWTQEGKKLEGLIPENFILYAELIGFTSGGAPIQKGYTYNHPIGTCSLWVYRVAFVNEKGFMMDLTWDQVREFCMVRGLNHVPELWRGAHGDYRFTDHIDVVLKDKHPHAVPLDKGTVDEGVCIRVDAFIPRVFKAKSPKFLEHETKLMDEGVEDMESVTVEV